MVRRMKTRPAAERPSRPVTPPIVLSSTFAFDDAEAMALSTARRDTPLYTRWSNPTVEALEARVAALEGADFCLGVASGMAAITACLLASCQPARVLLVQNEVYGGTHELAGSLLAALGIEVRRAPLDDLVEATRALPPGAGVHVEVPTNPLIRVVDLPALRAAAPVGTTISVDATFATPLNLRALEHGADLVAHSATKYLAGPSWATWSGGSASCLGRPWTRRRPTGCGAASRPSSSASRARTRPRWSWRDGSRSTRRSRGCTTPGCRITPITRWRRGSWRALAGC